MKKFVLTTAVLSLAFIVMPAVSLAQNAPSQAGQSSKGVIRLFDSTLVYPLPDWTNLLAGKRKLAASKYVRQEEPGIFGLEMTPKNEDPKNWRNFYALSAIRKFRGGLDEHTQIVFSGFNAACVPEKLKFSPVTKTERIAIMFAECGAYRKAPETGEVAVFAFLQRGNTAVRLYRQWRGPAFDLGQVTSWPVLPNTLESVIKSMSTASLGPIR